MTAPMVDYKIHWLKMMSVPESRAVVGRHDGINGRDSRRLWWLGYRRAAWTAGIGLGAATAAASLVAGLLGPVAVALYAVVLSVPVWIAWYWLVRRG